MLRTANIAGILRTTALFVLTVGLIHILTTLWLARAGTSPDITRLSERLPIHQMTILDVLTPATQAIPFMMPESHYSVCPFDLTTSPVRIQAHLPDAGWIFSLHGLDGQGYYFAPGSADRPLTLTLDIIPPGHALNGLELAADRADIRISKVTAPSPSGLAVIRAPVVGRSYTASVVRDLAKSNCSPVGRRLP